MNPLRSALSLAAALALLAGVATAQSGGDYAITKHAIAGGGGPASAGDYAVVGTVAQSQAAMQSGGTYRVIGGFLSDSGDIPPVGDAVFGNGFE